MIDQEEFKTLKNQYVELSKRYQDLEKKYDDLQKIHENYSRDKENYITNLKAPMMTKLYHRIMGLIGKIIPEFVKNRVKNKLIPGTLKETLQKYRKDLERILKENKKNSIKGVVIYPATIDWGHLFQRPQQLAISFSKHDYLFFYCTGNYNVDKVHGFEKIKKNLYLCNVPTEVFNILNNPILLISYTPNKAHIPLLKSPFIIYDHIDELEIFYKYDQKMEEDHLDLLKNADIVTATAKRLYEQDQSIRKDVLLCQNGVDYETFQISKKRGTLIPPKDMNFALDSKKPIIGYYGAIAPWIDFDLIKFASEKRNNFNFFFIGPDYGGKLEEHLKKHGLENRDNIFWLGPKKYEEIPVYLAFFDVAIIPFKINNITLSTSPIKMFEYMAGGKPVVTTDLPECRLYSSVLIAKTREEFIESLDKALELKNDNEYLSLLDKHAQENTWDSRVESIINLINKKNYEV